MNLFVRLGMLGLCAGCFSQQVTASGADTVLLKTARAVSQIKTLQYTLSREMYYQENDYHRTVSWNCFLDFTRNNNPAGCAYMVEGAGWKYVFNGTELFDLDKTNKTAAIIRQPQQKEFSGVSFFYNSVLTLKNVLPLLAADAAAAKSITDTVINNQRFFVVHVNTGKRRIQNLGLGFDAMQTAYSFLYSFIINPDTYMPLEVMQRFENSFIKTSFTQFTINAPVPEEQLWYYSWYKDYKELAGKQTLPLLAVGAVAPDWSLPEFNSNHTATPGQYKNHTLLVEFWIKNCGACIQSAAALNRLQQQYGNKKIKIIGINAYDPVADVALFCKKQQVNYTVLLNGKQAAAAYGVSGYPVFFVINTEGKIIYTAEGFSPAVEKDLENILRAL